MDLSTSGTVNMLMTSTSDDWKVSPEIEGDKKAVFKGRRVRRNTDETKAEYGARTDWDWWEMKEISEVELLYKKYVGWDGGTSVLEK